MPFVCRCRKSRIDIRVYGATGLSVEIPPYMERESLEVRINGKKLPCHGFSGGVLHFKHDSHGYRRISAAPLPPDTALGNGLIDVYLDPLCAVIPTGGIADGQTGCKCIDKTAFQWKNAADCRLV